MYSIVGENTGGCTHKQLRFHPAPLPTAARHNFTSFTKHARLSMSASSASSYKGTAVFKRFSSFLGRLPKCEEGWNVELTSPSRVEHLRQRLILPIAPHIRATLGWDEFFHACVEHVKSMGNVEDEAAFFKLVVLGASHVGMRETDADVYTGKITVDEGHRVRGVINNGTRLFLRCFDARSEQFPDNNLIDYRRAVRLGIDLLRMLDEKRIGPRAYELPLYGWLAELACLRLLF